MFMFLAIFLRSIAIKCNSLVVTKAKLKSLVRAKNKVETPCVYHKSLDYVRANVYQSV